MRLRNVLVPEHGRVRLKSLGPEHVERPMADRLTSGVSASTANREREVLRNTLNLAIRWGLLSRNVAALAAPMKGQRRETQPLTVEETRRFLASVQGDRLEALYLVAAMLGMRQGEILGLCRQDLVLDPDPAGRGSGELRVRRQLQWVDGEPRLVAPKSGTGPSGPLPCLQR